MTAGSSQAFEPERDGGAGVVFGMSDAVGVRPRSDAAPDIGHDEGHERSRVRGVMRAAHASERSWIHTARAGVRSRPGRRLSSQGRGTPL